MSLVQVGRTLPESDESVDKSPADEPSLLSNLPVIGHQEADTRVPHELLVNQPGAVSLRWSMCQK